MKFTLEHAIILILTIAVIYYVVQHRNLLTDLLSIPDRGHPELKKVKNKHSSDDVDCSKKGSTFAECSTNDEDILSYCGENPNAGWDDCRVTKLGKPIKSSTEYTYGYDSQPITINTGGDVWCNKQWVTNPDRGVYIGSMSVCHFPYQDVRHDEPPDPGTWPPEKGKVV